MNENKKLIFEEEKTINLVDACFYLLKQWKVMVAAAVILTVLAGGLSLVKSNKTYQENLAAQNTAPSAPVVVEMTEDEKAAYQKKLATIKEYQQYIKETDYYLANSLKLKLDPNGYYEGKITYIFSADKSAEALQAAEFCKGEVLNGAAMEALAAKLAEPVDTAMLSEVILDEIVSYITDESAAVQLTVKVQHYDQADCEILMAGVKETLEAATELFDENHISVKVNAVDAAVARAVAPELIGVSYDKINARNAVSDALKSIEEGLTEKEKRAYSPDKETEENAPMEVEGVKEVLPEVEKPSVSMKLVVVGAAAGIFLAAAFYGVLYLFGGKVHNKEELESWVAVPVLSSGKEPEVTAAMLAEMAEKEQTAKVYLTGSRDTVLAKAEEMIKAAMTEKKVEVICGMDGLNTADALAQMADCGTVIFVEKCNESKEKDLREEIEKASSCGVKVLGIVLEK